MGETVELDFRFYFVAIALAKAGIADLCMPEGGDF